MAAAERALDSGQWALAERGFADALRRGPALDASKRRAALGTALARLVGRVDARAAFPILQALASDESEMSDGASARLHAVLSLLFATPEEGLYDGSRSARHAQAAWDATDPDDAALAALGLCLARAPVASSSDFARVARAAEPLLGRARAPWLRCAACEVAGYALIARGALAEETLLLDDLLDWARTLDYSACEARVLARKARRALAAGDRRAAAHQLALATRALEHAGGFRAWLHTALGAARSALQRGDRLPLGNFAFEALGLLHAPAAIASRT